MKDFSEITECDSEGVICDDMAKRLQTILPIYCQSNFEGFKQIHFRHKILELFNEGLGFSFTISALLILIILIAIIDFNKRLSRA